MLRSGWINSGAPCYAPWEQPCGPAPRTAAFRLSNTTCRQFKQYDDQNHVRLLDYVDLHTYFAADNLAASAQRETPAAQEARLNSTRVFWDPTYTDPNFQQPNYITDSNYTASCNPPLQAPQVIPMMHKWVEN